MSAALRTVLPASVACIVVLGVALLVAANASAAWGVFAFVAGGLALAALTALLFIPRALSARAVAAAASALADGTFHHPAPAAPGELAAVAAAINAAGARLGREIGSLRDERTQLLALLNASSDATVAVDATGIVVYANDAARSIFEVAAPVGRPFIEAVRDHDLNEIVVAAAGRAERSVRVVTYGPSARWLQATAVPIEGAGAWAALATFHDLTEVRRLDSVRRDFISNVSHELRTPLAGIRAAAETLAEGAIDERDAAVEFLGHIQRETDRLTQMVEELLELSRIESGAAPLRFAQLDAAGLARDSARRFARQAERAGLKITADAPGEPLPIIGDAERLERAVGNLVANAIKFTPDGGAVTVSAYADGPNVAVAVRDSGVGIDPEQQTRVFERFFKADKGRGDGTGLGLAIVKHIAEAHGGRVTLTSYPGRGSTFTLLLPRR